MQHPAAAHRQRFRQIPTCRARLGAQPRTRRSGSTSKVKDVALDKQPYRGSVRPADPHGAQRRRSWHRRPGDRLRAGARKPRARCGSGPPRSRAGGHRDRRRRQRSRPGPDCRQRASEGIDHARKAQGLSDQDKAALIFLPGLSTAEKVSDVSGRGVGMDVVKTNLDRLGGKVEIDSQPGRGPFSASSSP